MVQKNAVLVNFATEASNQALLIVCAKSTVVSDYFIGVLQVVPAERNMLFYYSVQSSS
jgi:allophanate hydrolase subunit 1